MEGAVPTGLLAGSEAGVFAQLQAAGIIPVLSLETVADALAIGTVLLDEGLPAIEVTFRTPAAAEIIAALRDRLPGLMVGAGTLLQPGQVEQAIAAGAHFGVAPGLSEPVLSTARQHDLPFIPGVATPTEIERGLAHGLTLLKWFPAESLGGPRGLAQASAPYLHTGVRFFPTGGITAETAPAYLRISCVTAVGGSWMAPAVAVAGGDVDAVRRAIRATVELSRTVREGRRSLGQQG